MFQVFYVDAACMVNEPVAQDWRDEFVRGLWGLRLFCCASEGIFTSPSGRVVPHCVRRVAYCPSMSRDERREDCLLAHAARAKMEISP